MSLRIWSTFSSSVRLAPEFWYKCSLSMIMRSQVWLENMLLDALQAGLPVVADIGLDIVAVGMGGCSTRMVVLDWSRDVESSLPPRQRPTPEEEE